MSLDIASIDAISEINMDYTATIFLRQRWRDSRLLFPGNESVSVDGRLVSLLWIPDTFIPDSKRSFLHDVTVENRLIRIFSNGTVLYALRYVLVCCVLVVQSLKHGACNAKGCGSESCWGHPY
uniref:Neurotransmitter-gated ion-channel ligand-binding domain-containing protein n=1 Tax=Hucho hucho TaxID=62062 RepID=A0A4W5KK92_9TELE